MPGRFDPPPGWTPDKPLIVINDVHKSFGHVEVLKGVSPSMQKGDVANLAPGKGVVFTSISTGNSTCSETITYDYPAHGGQPMVNVSHQRPLLLTLGPDGGMRFAFPPYGAHSGQPVVHVSQSGNACGPVRVNGPARVQAAQPVTPYSIRPTVSAVRSPQPRLWQAVYQHPVTLGQG
jgi:hypothetical protein